MIRIEARARRADRGKEKPEGLRENRGLAGLSRGGIGGGVSGLVEAGAGIDESGKAGLNSPELMVGVATLALGLKVAPGVWIGWAGGVAKGLVEA